MFEIKQKTYFLTMAEPTELKIPKPEVKKIHSNVLILKIYIRWPQPLPQKLTILGTFSLFLQL